MELTESSNMMEGFDWSSGVCRNASDKSGGNGFTVNPGVIESGFASSSSLVLDNQMGELELMVPSVKERNKGFSSERSVTALKNHSEAERRRRARINAHLDTLRTVIPGANKMDKASLLAEVIRHVKELKGNAAEASEGLMVPKDSDEIRVEEQEGGCNGYPYYSIRASVCCEYKPGLLSDIRQELEALQMMIMKADIATLGGRMKNVFVIISCKEHNKIEDDSEYRQFLAGSVHRALKSVVDRFSASQDLLGIRKRRRISVFSSSSVGELW